MNWKERAQAMAEARAEVHDSYKIPVMISVDNAATWSLAWCRLHESVNPEGNGAGTKPNRIVVDTDSPIAIFRHSEIPSIANKAIVSVSPGVSYNIKMAPPPDQYGYRSVKLTRNLTGAVYPVPDWGSL